MVIQVVIQVNLTNNGQVDPQFNPTCPGYEYDDGTETGSDDGTQTANNGENTETFDNTTTASDALNERISWT